MPGKLPSISYVTHFYLNQDDDSSLKDLLTTYASYSPKILDEVHFILVDDGSPMSYELPDVDLNLTVLRITKDIPWNQAGARNLGIAYAKSDKVILTDLDHMFPEELLQYLLKVQTKPHHFYRFYRKNRGGPILRPHTNTYLLSRGVFLQHFGYDEEFAGHYGFEDSMFARWQRYHGTHFKYFPKSKPCILRDINREKQYHSLERDPQYNEKIAEVKQHEWKTYGPDVGHSRKFLSFPWEVTKETRRDLPPAKPNRLWAKTWWGRWLKQI